MRRKKISKQFFAQFFSYTSSQKSGNDKYVSILFPFPAYGYGYIYMQRKSNKSKIYFRYIKITHGNCVHDVINPLLLTTESVSVLQCQKVSLFLRREWDASAIRLNAHSNIPLHRNGNPDRLVLLPCISYGKQNWKKFGQIM
jgi:hypothetical protein